VTSLGEYTQILFRRCGDSSFIKILVAIGITASIGFGIWHFFVPKVWNWYSYIVMLAATCILWLTRLVLQLVYPQGSINPVLQYGMLSAFILVNLCYMFSRYIVMSQRIS
jgi:hypothetical protein